MNGGLEFTYDQKKAVFGFGGLFSPHVLLYNPPSIRWPDGIVESNALRFAKTKKGKSTMSTAPSPYLEVSTRLNVTSHFYFVV